MRIPLAVPPVPLAFFVLSLPVAPPVDLAQPSPELPLPAVSEPLAEPPMPELPATEAAPVAPSLAPATANPDADPADFHSESALFLQKQIGWWSLADARAFLGSPQRQRPALDDSQTPNGQIFAFADPTGRYREVELDFNGENGNLRTVFAYPWKMTWTECRQSFTGDVSAAQANKGRTFYSYVNRRLDVLVDPAGQVISLGLY